MYVDAILDRKTDQVKVVERVDGKRLYKTYPTNYVFYYSTHNGSYTTVFDTKASKFSASEYRSFMREKKKAEMRGHTIFESDMNPIFRCLRDHYENADSADFVLGFFDIETGFCPDRGYAPVENPFNPITTISLHTSDTNTLYTLTMKPPTLSFDEADAVCSQFENTVLYDNEADMLLDFFKLIDNVDVISGWNSTSYDIPYMVNRIKIVLGDEYNEKWCLWNQKPKKREFMRFNRINETYDLVGRVHLDYLELYKKHNPQELHSYRLDYVGEIEVGENKVDYEGTLDSLFKNDFDLFIKYSRQDVMLLVAIDKKKQFISLANQVALTNTVLLKTTMGSVALIEQAITNEANRRGLIVPDRKLDFFEENDDDDDDSTFYDTEEDEEKAGAVGAYVADPKKGLHKFVGSVDINSLYPSILRALNMSPETLLGHIRPIHTDAYIQGLIKNKVKRSLLWEGIFATLEFDMVHKQTDDELVIDFEDGTVMRVTAKELYNYIYKSNSNIVLSANGTLFRTDKVGIIPSLLARWYAERKTMQAREKTFANILDTNETLISMVGEEKAKLMVEGINNAKGNVADVDTGLFLKSIFSDDYETIKAIMIKENLSINDYKIIANDTAQARNSLAFWNQRQQARKILLNSLYGALLNEYMKFYDKRIGQSVTLTGRSTVKHMISKVNELLAGEYDHVGISIIYGDTDSVSGDTMIKTPNGDVSIEELFERTTKKFIKEDGKEYAFDDNQLVMSYNDKFGKPQFMPTNYLYRHKVTKGKWRVTDKSGNSVIMTSDHSAMVERDGVLMEVKPHEITKNDLIITIK